jgi:hypothetical protein
LKQNRRLWDLKLVNKAVNAVQEEDANSDVMDDDDEVQW